MSTPRKGLVRVGGIAAGLLKETPSAYRFTYDPVYLASPDAVSVSLTLPLRSEPPGRCHRLLQFGRRT